jgi:hypothetical protein
VDKIRNKASLIVEKWRKDIKSSGEIPSAKRVKSRSRHKTDMKGRTKHDSKERKRRKSGSRENKKRLKSIMKSDG